MINVNNYCPLEYGSYWQGDLDAKILVLGQDWGCFKGETNKELDKAMEKNFEKIDRQGKDAAFYFDGTNGYRRSDTDINLIKLFKVDGLEYEIGVPGCKGLFFSNLCLGYRNKGYTGGFKVKWLTDDIKYLLGFDNNGERVKGLLEIIEPSVVICLGKEVYRIVMREMAKKFSDKDLAIKPRMFYDDLEKKNNYKNVSWNGKEIRVYGVAHPGNQGRANRKSQVWTLNNFNEKVRVYDKNNLVTGEDLQKKDWEHIGEYVKNLI